MTEALIELHGVERHYAIGNTVVRALDGVDLEIADGELTAIMGPSGSGKSTLMNVLGCLDTPTSGAYRLSDVDVHQLDDDELADIRNRKIGFVFQTFNLLPRVDAVTNVALPLLYRGLEKSNREAAAREALRIVGLTDRAEHRPSELSGGQAQRVAIARALVSDPAVILADEPTGNLDSRSTDEILEIFEQLNASGRTVIMVTHEDDVAARAQRRIRMLDGRIAEDSREAGSQ